MKKDKNRSTRKGHTPGPWTTDGSRIFWPTSPHKRTPQHPEFTVAQCFSFCGQGEGTMSQEEVHANCALIASAPELLMVSKHLLKVLKVGDDGYVNGTVRVADLDRIRAIVNRAEAHTTAGHPKSKEVVPPTKLSTKFRSLSERIHDLVTDFGNIRFREGAGLATIREGQYKYVLAECIDDTLKGIEDAMKTIEKHSRQIRGVKP